MFSVVLDGAEPNVGAREAPGIICAMKSWCIIQCQGALNRDTAIETRQVKDVLKVKIIF